VAAFIKNLTRFLTASRPEPEIHLAAFGKHPGWDDHTDDMGLDTDALVAAKRLIYVQGISQNIDSAAWDNLPDASQTARATTAGGAGGGGAGGIEGRLDHFRHDFLWFMPPHLLAGRLWSSVDGKGRDKYPMVLCSEMVELPPRFATGVVLPYLADVHARCAAAPTAAAVRQIVDADRQLLRARVKDAAALPAAQPLPLTAREVAAVAHHPAMHPTRDGFRRIVYQFASGMAAYRPGAAKSAAGRRPEQLRLPACDLPPADALLFWLKFALSFLDINTPLLLIAPDQGDHAPWVDLIAGEPTPQNLFCFKAGTKAIPYTSDIPYSLELPFVRAVDNHLAACASAPENTPMPPWPF
jgi:hypothetical protein